MFAKMQVCCSHEIASVPYVPVPGLIYQKYKEARRYGVEGIMQCWYFGNYPSLMSKAAGELAFEDFNDENAFLERLAGIYWGETKAPQIVRAWRAFGDAYSNYPLNIMFSYYGPAHDSVVWKLALKPKNNSLPRTWLGVDPIDGDRIGECMLNGHTLDEVCQLVSIMSNGWHKGTEEMLKTTAEYNDEKEQQSVARAIDLLFDSASNILEFYRLRDLLGNQIGDQTEILSRMMSIAECEIANSQKMLLLCESDGRLGYHSEAEGYKFFPEKLKDRIDYLHTLLETEFVDVAERIRQGLSPLEYYDGIEDVPSVKHYDMLCRDLDDAAWESVGDGINSRFRLAYDSENIYLELLSDERIKFVVAPEFKLFHPDAVVNFAPDGQRSLAFDYLFYNSLFGDRADKEMAKYSTETIGEGGTHLRITIRRSDAGLDQMRPFKLKIKAGSTSWCSDPGTRHTLGREHVIPREYGWIIPKA